MKSAPYSWEIGQFKMHSKNKASKFCLQNMTVTTHNQLTNKTL